MTEERRRVLDMLAEGKVTVEEAERLLEALQGTHREARKGRIPPIPSVGGAARHPRRTRRRTRRT